MMSREEIEEWAKQNNFKVDWVPNPFLNFKKKVYLAGPVTNLSYDVATNWRDTISQMMDSRIVCYSPLRAKQYLKHEMSISYKQEEVTNHGGLSEALSSDKGIVRRDRFDCKTADLVLMNLLGAKKVSIGTMVEIGWATAYDVPLIIVMEEVGNVHDHMMVRTAPFIVHNLNDAVDVVHAILLP